MKPTRELVYIITFLPCLAFSFSAARLYHSSASAEDQNVTDLPDCKHEEFDPAEVVFLNDSSIFLIGRNVTVRSTDYHHHHSPSGKVRVCLVPLVQKDALVTDCRNKFVYDGSEYEVLPNRSVVLYGEVIGPGEYKLNGSKLLICATDYGGEWDEGGPPNLTSGQEMIYVGQIGSGISIVALTMFLVAFCVVPALRNLPGCNLASLCVAFLFAYSFLLIGQIREVLGTFCVVSGILQQNFFLSAFFCMNVLAFDVWRTLRLATEKLLVGTSNVRKKFLWYTLYGWGCPVLITTTSALLDNLEGVPEKLRPRFGADDTCWMTNYFAKMLFFALPAFSLLVVNGVFFFRSFAIISNNVMRCRSDLQKQNVRVNYVLYLRLGVMMGLTWLVGIVALLSGNDVVWLVHDVLNSLQGLFLFLLFTCSRKVVKHIKGKSNAFSFTSSEKVISTISNKVDPQK